MSIEKANEKEIDILEHRVEPKNELQAQIILAEELYLKENPDANIKDHDVRNAIMARWSDRSKGESYSHAFRKILEKNKGDFESITLADIDKLVEENSKN